MTDRAILSLLVVLCVCCGKSCASGCMFQYVGVRKGAGKGGLLWNWVVNSLSLSADYSGMGLGPQAWENRPLFKITQLWAQPISNSYSTQSWRAGHHRTTHKTEQLILTDGFFVEMVVLLSVPRFVCPDLCKGVCRAGKLGDGSDR